MKIESLIIDNCGFDVLAMAGMSEKEFVDTHMGNDAICQGKTAEQKTKWLKDAHKAIKAKAKTLSAAVKNDNDK